MRFRHLRRAPGRAVLAWLLLLAGMACGQPVDEGEPDLVDRPISEIRIVGLRRVPEQLVRNQLRSAVGDPYDPGVVKGDVALMYRLGEFGSIDAEVEPLEDGSVLLVYRLAEAAIIAEVQVVGNKVISDQDLLAAARVARGLPRDDFRIEKAKRAIESLYRERGHYLTTVSVDESALDETGILLFRVIEGPRVKVKAIEFEGNQAFTDDQLHAEISTRTAVPLFRRGELDEDKLIDDVSTLDRYYKDRGFLDVRVDRTVELSPDSTEVKVTFLIVEGRLFTLRAIRTQPETLQVFAQAQIENLIDMRRGDVFSQKKIEQSRQALKDAYGLMGYLDVRVDAQQLRSGDEPQVDLLLRIDEGKQYKVGIVHITGNFLTLDRVIRRELRNLRPGRPFDARELQRAAQRIRATRLFSDVHIVVQDPDPGNPEYRDLLVEVRESNTGSVNFGIAAGSDTGLFGEFSLNQRNFDITDFPESPGELISGRAFRGGGQRFNMTLRPGNELFQYVMSWTEPNFFDTDNSLRVTGMYAERQFRSGGSKMYDETRLSFPITLSRRLGEIWDLAVTGRFERVELDDIDPTAPVDVFVASGPDTLTSLRLALIRSTVTTFTRPGEGSRTELSWEQFGSFGGDYTFSKVEAEHTVFMTMQRDFLGRESILKVNGRAAYIFGSDDAPLYERFYLGGRSFRGFDFRTISPKGINRAGVQTDDPVGGDWLIFLGAQYEVPLIGEALTGVVFLDTGTVVNDVGFDDYRVSAGFGVRIYIQQFGPVPIAFDFGFPLRKETGDDTEVFSFSAELPF
ncbi:MAG: BamA/OMP85 family outer membrane protein [Planctomycetota bacterium]|jgi:outer membrane protein insertion porin family